MQNHFQHYDTLKKAIKPAESKTGNQARRVDDHKSLTGLTYGIFVNSTVSSGVIKKIDNSEASRIPGVLDIITHFNRSSIPAWQLQELQQEVAGQHQQPFELFSGQEIHFYQQPVALVIADNFECALKAAALVQVMYSPMLSDTVAEDRQATQKLAGHYRAISQTKELSAITIRARYRVSPPVNVPSEIHGAVMAWDLLNEVTEANRAYALKTIKKSILADFDISEENLKIHFTFTGPGSETSKNLLPHEVAAILGAKRIGKPLLVITGQNQLFNMIDQGQPVHHDIVLGACLNGQVNHIGHHFSRVQNTCREIVQKTVYRTGNLYTDAHSLTVSKCLQPGNIFNRTGVPNQQIGSFGIECILDELSYHLNTDPIELRLINFRRNEPAGLTAHGMDQLRKCYTAGRQIFEWHNRNPQPRSMRTGDNLSGIGSSAGTGEYKCVKCFATATYALDGSLLIKCVTDGTNETTGILKDVAAKAFGLELSAIHIVASDTFLGPDEDIRLAQLEETCSLVHELVRSLRQKIDQLIAQSQDIVKDVKAHIAGAESSFCLADILSAHNLSTVVASLESNYTEDKRFSVKSYCTYFVEVLVQPVTGKIRVKKVLAVIDAGKIINLKSAAIEMHLAILESVETSIQQQNPITDLAAFCKYTAERNLRFDIKTDIPSIEIVFVNQLSKESRYSDGKKIIELEYTGLPAAIANAVYHATGERVRSLPICLNR